MTDVTEMLGLGGVTPNPTISIAEEAMKLLSDKPKAFNANKVKKPKGMSREVFELMGRDGFLALVPSNTVSIKSFKEKRNTSKGKWIWNPVVSSCRPEGEKPFSYHWVKAELSFADHPFAKFNVSFAELSYQDDEYAEAKLAKDTEWSRADTDQLVQACNQYELRWPVIYDRIELSKEYPLEEMQFRYYDIKEKLDALRNTQSTGATRIPKIDVQFETKRRKTADMLFRRSKEDELEEIRLRDELKNIESSLKKTKKTKGAVAPKATEKQTTPVVITNPEAVLPPPPANERPSILAPVATAAPAPAPGKPYLQSSRLFVNEQSLGLSKNMLTKMNSYLKEINMPEYPLPTKTVCDLVEHIRRDTIALISIHNAIKKKEREINEKKGIFVPSSSSIAAAAAAAKAELAAAAEAEAAAAKETKVTFAADPELNFFPIIDTENLGSDLIFSTAAEGTGSAAESKEKEKPARKRKPPTNPDGTPKRRRKATAPAADAPVPEVSLADEAMMDEVLDSADIDASLDALL